MKLFVYIYFVRQTHLTTFSFLKETESAPPFYFATPSLSLYTHAKKKEMMAIHGNDGTHYLKT